MGAGSLVGVPLPNGAWAALWMLESSAAPRSSTFFVLEGFWPKAPSATELARAKVAHARGTPLPGCDGRWKGWFQRAPPKDFVLVGRRAVSAKERAAAEEASGTMIFQNGEHLRTTLFVEWRMRHDRKALEAEWARAEAKRAKKSDARRRDLTLARLLREKAFPQAWWSPPAVREVRRVFREATRALVDLEERGTPRQRTAVLKGVVTALNELDDHEGFIETEAREMFVERIEELARLVGLNNDDEKLTGHRDW